MGVILGLVRIGGFLLALGCAAAALGGQAGRWSPRLDVLNHFELVWVIGAILAVALGWRDRATVVLAALALAAAALQMTPELLARDKPAQTAEGPALKLVQFNVWFRNRAPAPTAAWLLEQDADIIVLEEAFGGAAPVVKALSARYPYQFSCGDKRHACSTLVLSRRPAIAGGPLSGSGLVASWASFNGPGGPFIVVGLHSTHPYPPPWQQVEHDRLVKALARFDQERLILAGDFNSTPWSFGLKRLDRRLQIRRLTHAEPSWPAQPVTRLHIRPPLLLLPIDQVYAGKGWAAVSVKRGPRLGSDHVPIVVTLRPAG